MLRVIVVACVLCLCGPAFAQPEELVPYSDPLTVLKIRYRSARAKGDSEQAIKILRQIVLVEPRNADWRLKLAEDLLRVRRVDEARREFTQALNTEPEFHEARVGIARTFALQRKHHLAKAQMLEAARRGYRAALMMRKGELSEHFRSHQFAIDLLEADRPKIGAVRDPFENPLPRPPKDSGPGDDDEKKKKKKQPVLTPEEQEEIARGAVEALEKGQAEIGKGNIEKALAWYKKIMDAFEKKKLFTEKEHLDTLTQTHGLARELLYPRIQKRFREQAMSRANALLDKLFTAVRKRDREEAQRLNGEIADVVQKALQAQDEALKKEMELIEAERARVYETVEILVEYDRDVAPRLTLRGTIIGRDSRAKPKAFLDVRSEEGTRGYVLTKGDAVPAFEDLHVTKVEENAVHLSYRGVEVRMLIGAW